MDSNPRAAVFVRKIPQSAYELWAYHCYPDSPTMVSVDGVLGLGSYDVSVATFAADVFFKTNAEILLFTGDKGNWTADLYATSEAEHFSQIAQQSGVPKRCIFEERKATNIAQNITLSEAMLPSNCRRVLYVTKPQTQRRLLLSLKVASCVQEYGVSAPQRQLDDAIELFGVKRIFNEMVGDMHRILHYPDLGWMAREPIPEQVLSAWQDLIARGYIDHLIPDVKF